MQIIKTITLPLAEEINFLIVFIDAVKLLHEGAHCYLQNHFHHGLFSTHYIWNSTIQM